jgi:hypothetical protein
MDRDSHESFRRPPNLGPGRKRPQTCDHPQQNAPFRDLLWHGLTSSVGPNMCRAGRYLNARAVTAVPSLDDKLNSFTSNRCAPK